MAFEEYYQDVLQNLEFAIIQVYRNQKGLMDYDVSAALEGLIKHYISENSGRKSRALDLHELSQEVFDSVKGVAEWRLGRGAEERTGASPKPLEIEELIQCLKRLQKSLKFWTKKDGRQGLSPVHQPLFAVMFFQLRGASVLRKPEAERISSCKL